jgi:excisionase family DNA binding protein
MDLRELRESTAATVPMSAVADLFDVDVRTVSRAVADGAIPSIRLGRRVLIPREPLLALLSADSTGAA